MYGIGGLDLLLDAKSAEFIKTTIQESLKMQLTKDLSLIHIFVSTCSWGSEYKLKIGLKFAPQASINANRSALCLGMVSSWGKIIPVS